MRASSRSHLFEGVCFAIPDSQAIVVIARCARALRQAASDKLGAPCFPSDPYQACASPDFPVLVLLHLIISIGELAAQCSKLAGSLSFTDYLYRCSCRVHVFSDTSHRTTTQQSSGA